MDHRLERAKERYGLDLTLSDIAALERQIAEGRAPLLKRKTDGLIYGVRHGDVVLFAVIGHRPPHIVTFLTQDCFAPKRNLKFFTTPLGKSVRKQARIHERERRRA